MSDDYEPFQKLQYNGGWHRCRKCLLVRPEKQLKLTEGGLYWICASEVECHRLRGLKSASEQFVRERPPPVKPEPVKPEPEERVFFWNRMVPE